MALSAAFLAVFFNLNLSVALAGDSMNEKKTVAPANLIRVPLTRQATDYTCGVAALQSVFMHYGDEVLESALAKELKSNPNDGTAYQEIVRLARSRGYSVTVKTGMSIADLRTYIDEGKPVIVLLQAWPEKPVDYSFDWDDGHYAVAIGYDSDNVFFMDPSTHGNYTFVPADEFLARWHDTDSKVKLEHFGMIIEKKSGPTFNPDVIKKME